MDVPGQGREVGDLLHMFLPVQHRLPEVGDAPALGDVEPEEGGQLPRRLFGDGVAPGAEGGQLAALPAEGEVAVHHRRKPEGGGGAERLAVLRLDRLFQPAVAVLHPLPDVFEAVGPDPVLQPVLPVVAAGGEGGEVRADQDGFDAGGAQLQPEGGFPFPDGGNGLFMCQHSGCSFLRARAQNRICKTVQACCTVFFSAETEDYSSSSAFKVARMERETFFFS